MKEEEVERLEKKIDYYLTQLIGVNNSTPTIDEYIYNLMIGICGKKVEKKIFGGIKENTYTRSDLNLLGKEFKVKINFMNYDGDKTLSKEFSDPNESEVYILLAKKAYYFLYCKNRRNLEVIEVVGNNKVDMDVVEKIFGRPQSAIGDSQR